MATRLAMLPICFGATLVKKVPSPSCPKPLAPQAHKVLSAFSASVCALPPAMMDMARCANSAACRQGRKLLAAAACLCGVGASLGRWFATAHGSRGRLGFGLDGRQDRWPDLRFDRRRFRCGRRAAQRDAALARCRLEFVRRAGAMRLAAAFAGCQAARFGRAPGRDQMLVAIAENQQVSLGIGQHRTAHLVRPVIVMGDAAARADRFGTVANKLVGELIWHGLYRKCAPGICSQGFLAVQAPQKNVYFSITCKHSLWKLSPPCRLRHQIPIFPRILPSSRSAGSSCGWRTANLAEISWVRSARP